MKLECTECGERDDSARAPFFLLGKAQHLARHLPGLKAVMATL